MSDIPLYCEHCRKPVHPNEAWLLGGAAWHRTEYCLPVVAVIGGEPAERGIYQVTPDGSRRRLERDPDPDGEFKPMPVRYLIDD
jgi:hypothetical protein